MELLPAPVLSREGLPQAGGGRRPGSLCEQGLEAALAQVCGVTWSQTWSLISGHSLPTPRSASPSPSAHRPPWEGRVRASLGQAKGFRMEGTAPALEELVEQRWHPPRKPQGKKVSQGCRGQCELGLGQEAPE